MPQFMGDQHGVNAGNESGAVLFEIGGSDSYDYSDAYYRTLGTRVVMTASLKKFTRIAGAGKMGAISHDAIYFSGRKGKKVPLAVFGYIVTNPSCGLLTSIEGFLQG
jgi:hypothetical protein